MNLNELMELYKPSNDPEVLGRQVARLRTMVMSLCKDMEVLRNALREKGTMTDSDYRRLRTATMIHDHWSPGPDPWTLHSDYAHGLSEEEFLRHVFRATDEEVRAFKDEARSGEILT